MIVWYVAQNTTEKRKLMKYSLDIFEKTHPFVNIEVENDSVLLGAYECGKIARKLFFINKEELELLIKGLIAANTLIHNEVDFKQFLHKERIV